MSKEKTATKGVTRRNLSGETVIELTCKGQAGLFKELARMVDVDKNSISSVQLEQDSDYFMTGIEGAVVVFC